MVSAAKPGARIPNRFFNHAEVQASTPYGYHIMLYEAEVCDLVENNQVVHPGLEVSRITARLLSEIRRQTGVVFPADGPQGGVKECKEAVSNH